MTSDSRRGAAGLLAAAAVATLSALGGSTPAVAVSLGASLTPSGVGQHAGISWQDITWSTVDFASSSCTLTHDTEDVVPPGTTVTETYTGVEDGEPVSGVTVGFLMTGPGAYEDADFGSFGVTDANGRVTYVFTGADLGTATVQAMVTDASPEDGDQPVPRSRTTDSVIFNEGYTNINLRLRGASRGSKDLIEVRADPVAAGAATNLRVHGREVRARALSESGEVNFTVRDRNGHRYTRYRVLVQETATTRSATSVIRIS